jgi:hypothetical protein
VKDKKGPTEQTTTIRVGDFVNKTFQFARTGRCISYKALVIEPFEDVTLKDGEVVVKFLRQQGKAFVFPDVDDT